MTAASPSDAAVCAREIRTGYARTYGGGSPVTGNAGCPVSFHMTISEDNVGFAAAVVIAPAMP